MTRIATRCARSGIGAALVLAILLFAGCGGDDTTSPTDITPPSAVTDLAVASATTSSVTLAWTAPGDDGATGTATQYDVRHKAESSDIWDRMTRAVGEPAPRSAGSTESFTVTELTTGMPYVFRLRVADDAGNWSAESNEVVTSTQELPDTMAPWWGNNFVTTGYASPTTLVFVWYAPTDDRGAATVYDIRYATGPGTVWDAMTVLEDDTPPAEPSAREIRALAGLIPDTSYYFRVKAADAAGNWSFESHEGSGRTTRAGNGTEVTGDLFFDMVWTAAGSPYRLVEGVRIRGATLTIEPGVEVWGGGIGIDEGALIADADGGAPIRFARASIGTQQGTVPTVLGNPPDFAYVSGSILRNCVLDTTIVDGVGGLGLVDCTVRNGNGTSVSIRASGPLGGYATSIVRCRFEDNDAGEVGACIELDGGWLRLYETTLARNSGFSILSVIGNTVIEGCRFEQNALFTLQPAATVILRGADSTLDISCSTFTGNLYASGHGGRDIFVDALTATPILTAQRCNFEMDRTVVDNNSHGHPDARNNWWGTTSRALVEAAIRDSLDVPCCLGRVRYEPFRSSPVGSEECRKEEGR